jgi:hypothetical protein
MIMRPAVLAIIVFAICLSACRGSRSDSGDSSLEATGIVEYVELEGGFFGIVTEDGRRWDPTNLADEFKVDGLRVRVRVRPAADRLGTHMWGIIVDIEEIDRL